MDFERARVRTTERPRLATGLAPATAAFNLVGLRWRGRAEPAIGVRVRRPGAAGAAGTGSSTPARTGSAAALRPGSGWAGRDAVQYRLSRRVPGLRLHFVNVGRRRARARARAAQAADATPFPYVRARTGAPRAAVPRQAPRTTGGEGRARAPHGLAQRLLARRGARRSCSPSAATTATPTAGTTSATTRSSTSTARSTRAAPAGSTRRWSAPRRRASTRRPPASRTSATTRPWRRRRRRSPRPRATSAGS